MTGHILILLLVLLAAGAVTLFYTLRKRKRAASAETNTDSLRGVAGEGDGDSESVDGVTERHTVEPPPSTQHAEGEPEPSLAPDNDSLTSSVSHEHSATVEDTPREEMLVGNGPEVPPAPIVKEREDVNGAGPKQESLRTESVTPPSASDEGVSHLIPERLMGEGTMDSESVGSPAHETPEETGPIGTECAPRQVEASEESPHAVEETGAGDEPNLEKEERVRGVLEGSDDRSGDDAAPAPGMPPEPEITRGAATPPEATNPPSVAEGSAVIPGASACVGVGGEARGNGMISEVAGTTPNIDQLPSRVEKAPKERKPRNYQGLARSAPQPQDSEPPSTSSDGREPATRDRSLPIEVRLRFDRGGFCSLSLLAKRSAGLPEDLTATAPGGEVTLRAMQDEWYQDVVPDDISRVLRDGTVWTQEGANGQCTWSLSGRPLYVLADRPDISGYVSQPCLDLGRDHVVLCSEPFRSRVEEAIRETGAQPTTILDESFGTPRGWVVFRGVVPSAPVDPVGEADIFNALRPLPSIEISLERGIRLGYGNWLDGHPPSIRVYGDPEHVAEVRIDGQVASCDADDAYRASGWDVVGSHSVWCAGTSRSYSIVPFEASWELWEAYAFPAGSGETQRLAVCGPVVRVVAFDTWGAAASVCVPGTNPVLLGPDPGQIAVAVRASSTRGAPYIASPSFRPIWALPRAPLRCDKKTIRIVLVAGSDPPKTSRETGGEQVVGVGADVGGWCRLILDASRKGMKTDPGTESARALWLSYKSVARQIWRAGR